MNYSNRSLLVEGWRGINHSFALVNQFQLLELTKCRGLTLTHSDAPFHFEHWSRAVNGAGFHPEDEATLSTVPVADPQQTSDWTYRIFSPVDLRPARAGGKLAVFLAVELGLDGKSFAAGSDLTEFQSAGNLIITPSNWSRDRVIDWGFQPTTVHVIPHAASRGYFFPLSVEVNQHQKSALGFSKDEVILLNVGAAIWNKGIDVLLRGFALARQRRKDLRLVFKDQRNTYGISGDAYVKSTLASVGLLTDDVLSAITLIPANLTMDQMNSMYGIADCYVSPYRAEGFNLPVCEAMACGTPVIVTSGGATDDFVFGAAHQKITSSLHKNERLQNEKIGAYYEPDLDHLVELLIQVQAKTYDKIKLNSNSTICDSLSWQSPVDQLLALMH